MNNGPLLDLWLSLMPQLGVSPGLEMLGMVPGLDIAL